MHCRADRGTLSEDPSEPRSAHPRVIAERNVWQTGAFVSIPRLHSNDSGSGHFRLIVDDLFRGWMEVPLGDRIMPKDPCRAIS